MPRLLILLAAVCFGTTGTAAALGADGASPVTVGAARIAVGAAGLQLAAHWARGRRIPTVAGPPGPATGTLRSGTLRSGTLRSVVVWLGAAAVASYQVTFFLAVRTTGVAIGTVVALGSAPVLTGALAALAGHGRPGRRWIAATVTAAAGLAVLTLGAGAGGARPAGVLLALGAGLSYALYTVVVKDRLGHGVDAESLMAAVFTGGAVLLAPALLVLPVGWIATGRGLAAALWLGLVPTAGAYVLFARGLRHVSAAEASTLTLAEPLTAAALGVLLLGEQVTAPSAAGAALLLGGLVVLAAPRRAASRGGAAGAGRPGHEEVAA